MSHILHDTTMADCVETPRCAFCGGSEYFFESRWLCCEECGAASELDNSGAWVLTESPDDSDLVSRLLHELRGAA